MCSDDSTKRTECEMRQWFETHGRYSLWEKLKEQGWPYDVTESANFVAVSLVKGELDAAYNVARALFPVLVGEVRQTVPVNRAWAGNICVLVRVALLFDGFDRAESWLDEAIETATCAKVSKPVVNTLMSEAAYLLFLNGNSEKQGVAFKCIVKLLGYDFQCWTLLARRNIYEAALLCDIGTRLCDLCLISSICGFRVPPIIVDRAKLLHRLATVEPPWQSLPDTCVRSILLREGIRHLATALAYFDGAAHSLDYHNVDSPYLELELAFLAFKSTKSYEHQEAAAQRFLCAFQVWRYSTRSEAARRVLRHQMGTLSGPFLAELRDALVEQTMPNWKLLSEAEELLGPSRWIHDQLADAPRAINVVPSVTALAEKPTILHARGVILQLLPAGDDLIVIVQKPAAEGDSAVTYHGSRVQHGTRKLRRIHATFFGAQGRITFINKHLAQLGNRDIRCFHKKRLELHRAADDASKAVGSVLPTGLEGVLAGHDVLLVCSDPSLLCLPWSLAAMDEHPLITHVRSLTVSASIGVSNGLATIAGKRRIGNLCEIAAYGDRTQGLNWQRLMKDRLGNRIGLARLAEEGSISLRTIGLNDDDIGSISVQSLKSYPQQEADVLLVAGHGNPLKGVRLGDEYWHPLRAADDWRLERTECAIVPSCRLGELLWYNDVELVAGDSDGTKQEIAGFMAHLCLARIPRVLACPWIAYDVNVCRLVSSIIEHAVKLRSRGQPCSWARSLRDVVVDELSSPAHNRPYDLANLLLFGTP